MQNDKELSFAELLSIATDQGEWVNGTFEALVGNAKDGNGKAPNKADIFDPRDTSVRAKVAMFGGSFRNYEGRLCRFSGNGAKAKLYKGDVEITLGKNGVVTPLSEPARNIPAPKTAPVGATGATPAPGATRSQAPAVTPTQTAAEAEVSFHREMKRICLLLLHARQYLDETVARIGADNLTPEQVQSLSTSIFMTAKERGLLSRPPALRAVGEDGLAKPFVAPAKAADPEADAKAKEEAERKRQAEAARVAEEERLKREREELDQDVPF